MKFFVILEILLIIARVTVEFIEVPALTQTVLTWACVVIGAIALVFIGVRIYRELRGGNKE